MLSSSDKLNEDKFMDFSLMILNEALPLLRPRSLRLPAMPCKRRQT